MSSSASARRKFLRAAGYMFVAEVVDSAHDGTPGRLSVHRDARAAFRQGVALEPWPVQHVEVPFEGAGLPALVVPAAGDGPAPCMVHFDGEDDVKEVTYAAAVRERSEAFSLEGLIDRLRCPLLVLHGENDRQVPLWAAERTVQRTVNAASTELRVFGPDEHGDEHCQGDLFTQATDFIADWLDRFFFRPDATTGAHA